MVYLVLKIIVKGLVVYYDFVMVDVKVVGMILLVVIVLLGEVKCVG